MSYKDIRKNWTETAKFWQKVRPTYKPSKAEIGQMKKLVKLATDKKRNPRILVLGATPEIRKMLNLKNVTIIDNNPVMIKAMDSLIPKVLKNPREKKVVGNWLRMPFEKDSFDIIVGDHPLSSIFYRDFLKFFSELNRILEIGGHVILDIHINAQMKSITLDEYIEKYKKNKKWWRNFDNQVQTQYQLIMGDEKYYNERNFQSQWGKMERDLRKLYKSGRITRQEYQDLRVNLGENYVFTFPPKKAVDRIIRQFFQIKKAVHLPLHQVYQYYRLYFAKVKK